MTLTAEMIAQERLRLGNAVNKLLDVVMELGAVQAVYMASGNSEGADIVQEWIDDLRDLSDAVDASLGEFTLDALRGIRDAVEAELEAFHAQE